MQTRLINVLDSLRTSFWVVPAGMVVGAAGLAVLMLVLDEQIGDRRIERFRWLYTGGPEAAREFLSTVAASAITVAGVVFSITIVVLSLASQQLGPRLLRTFMRDRGTQFVLGTFVSTFLYCLIILRSVRKIDDEPLVPHLSIAVALLLAVLSLAVLIFFIHHVSSFIQAHNVIAAVAEDMRAAIPTLFPRRLGEPADGTSPGSAPPQLPEEFAMNARPVRTRYSGYVQAIEEETLLQLAVENDLILQLKRRPGHFVATGADLMLAHPADRVSDGLARRLAEAFILGAQRTTTQDVEFALEQLVEIAVRALSPGLNDPFTAVTCIDRLTGLLCEISTREMPQPFRADKSGKLRVVAYPQTFVSIIDVAYNQLRQNGAGKPAVAIRLLESITTLATCVSNGQARQRLLEQAMGIQKAARRQIADEHDLKEVEGRYLTAARALGE